MIYKEWIDKEDTMFLEEFEEMYKRISNMSKKNMTIEFNKLSIPNRKEFLKLLHDKSVDAYDDFIDDIRDVAVQTFWTNERELINQGECTRDWVVEQIESIYNINEKTGNYRSNGGAAIFIDVKGNTMMKKHGSSTVNEAYEAHQMLSVDVYPEHAGDYRNLQALGRSNNEHIKAHRGNYQNSTCWYYGYEEGKYYKIGN